MQTKPNTIKMNDKFFEYADYLTTEEDEILYQLRRETHLKTLFPRMISGHIQGKFLEILSKIIQPKNILEIGTYTGYSTICLARGLQHDGKLITIEKNDELQPIIDKYLSKANLQNKVQVIYDDALNVLPKLNEKFDLVFIDAEKRYYLNFYKLIFSKVKVGGIIIIDNIFWNGKIFENKAKMDNYTKGVVELNEFIKRDNRVEQVALPIRDGLLIARKIKD